MTMRRAFLLIGLFVIVAGALVWRHQSEVIGFVAQKYFARVGRQDDKAGDLTRRREVVTRMNRQLLMPAAADGHVPELFDVVTLLTPRVANGEITWPWAAYVYTSYQRDLVGQRPDGTPRRSEAEVLAQIENYVGFYTLQKRPDVPGMRFKDVLGVNDEDVITLEEIEAAEREGRDPDELLY